MSEPAGIIGLIKIDEKSLRKYLKLDKAKLLINSMYETIKSDIDDFYIFKFDKKSEVLSILITYDGGDSETIQGEDFLALKALSEVFTEMTDGFLIGYNNIVNQEEMVFALHAQPSGWVSIEDSQLNEFQYDIIDTFITTSQFIQGKFSDCYSSKFLFTPVVTNLNKLTKAEIELNTLASLPNASPSHPINLFNNFYYNGHNVFYINRGIHILDGLDPYTLKPKKYGASDAQHVVVKTYFDTFVTLKIDAKHFKSLREFDRLFYLTETQVFYGSDMQPLLGACPKSFKILYYTLQEDNERYYFYDHIIDKKTISDYKIVPFGFYREHAFFLSKELILCKNDEISPELIDIETFKLIKAFQVELHGKNELYPLNYMIKASDKDGDLLILSYKNKSTIDIIRDLNEIAALIETHDVTLDKFYNESDVKTNKYQKHFLKDPTDISLLSDMTELFTDYFSKYTREKNTKFLDKIIKRYEFLSQTPFLPNEMYPMVILSYHGLEQEIKMLETIERALLNGCNGMVQVWDVLDSTLLENNSTYQKLRAFDQTRVKIDGKIVIDRALLDAILSSNNQKETINYLTNRLFTNVYFPSLKEIEFFKSLNPNTIFINNDKVDWDEYTDKLIQVFHLFFPDAAGYLESVLPLYQSHEYMPVQTFLKKFNLSLMQYQYLSGLNGRQFSMAKFISAINNLIALIATYPETYKKEAYKSLYSSELYKVLFP